MKMGEYIPCANLYLAFIDSARSIYQIRRIVWKKQ